MRRERSEERLLGQHGERTERWYDRYGGLVISCSPSLPLGEQKRALRHDSHRRGGLLRALTRPRTDMNRNGATRSCPGGRMARERGKRRAHIRTGTPLERIGQPRAPRYGEHNAGIRLLWQR